MEFLPFLHRAIQRENLTAEDAESAMELILQGQATAAQIAGFLVALHMKGEAPDEILGFARAMRAKAVKVSAGVSGEPLLDTCGTGGDHASTFNISTVTAFVVAGAGVKVAKHGNRSISSQCGSADLLEALGVNLQQDAAEVGRSIREVGIGFLYAPSMHPAVKYAQAVRRELKIRTAFNLLGPLTNPAGATVQVAGAPSVRAAELMAQTLASLGLQRGFVVHGKDGLDEITTTTESLMLEIRAGAIAHHTVTPEDFGVRRAEAADLRCETSEASVARAKSVLSGETGSARDIVLANAAVALVAAGRAHEFVEAAQIAARSIDSGAAQQCVSNLATFTQKLGQFRDDKESAGS